jgi:hypothetical protein
MTKFLIISLIADVVAIGLAIFSVVIENKASKRLETAVKELHESHVELHELIKRVP